MKRRISLSLMAAACASLPLALAAPGQAHAQSVMRPASSIVLSIGRGQLVSVPGAMKDVFVANEAVADVQIKSQRQLYVFGKSGGETTIYASNAAGQVIWSANIRVGSNIESVDQMLSLAMPDAKITVTSVGTNTFLLTGTVASPEDAAEAQRLVLAFVGGGASGGTSNVISRLKTATPLQVSLIVRFAEVSRSLVREISSNLSAQDTQGGFLFGVARGNGGGSFSNVAGTTSGISTTGLPVLDASTKFGLPVGTISLPFDPVSGKYVVGGSIFTPKGNNVGQTALSLAGKLFGMNVASSFDLAERIGLVTTLSQPNLTALSGETADFLAGGEYPIPISQGLGATSIEYKRFGVSLSYTPTVLANGRISIRVRPEVSELSSQGAVTLNGFQVPALTIRRAETTVELGSGQSFMIAGLMSNNTQNSIDKTPGVGDIPILGTLFRSTSFRRGETELVIVVTPYLVNPVDANDIKLPTDGYQSPQEIQRLLGNIASDGKSGVSRPMPTAAPPRVAGPEVSVGGSADPASGRSASNYAGNNSNATSGNATQGNARSAKTDAPAPGFNLK
ncbi:MAG: type II and III secretion system protein family protein [Novosphingobium sp.]